MARTKTYEEMKAEAIRRADAACAVAVERGKAKYAKQEAKIQGFTFTCAGCGEEVAPKAWTTHVYTLRFPSGKTHEDVCGLCLSKLINDVFTVVTERTIPPIDSLK